MRVRAELWHRGGHIETNENPGMKKPVVINVLRDEAYITTMWGLLAKFTAGLQAKKQKLINLGHLEDA